MLFLSTRQEELNETILNDTHYSQNFQNGIGYYNFKTEQNIREMF